MGGLLLRIRAAIALAALTLAVLPVGATATPDSEHAIESRSADVFLVLQGKRAAAEVFEPAFLSAIPEAQLRQIADGIAAEHGELTGVDEVKPGPNFSGQFLLRFERAVAKVLLQLEPSAPYRIAGLRITAVTPLDDGPPRLLADYVALPGQSGFGLYRLNAEGPLSVLTKGAARQMAIGSTFKLWVLDAVAEDVAAGRLLWDQVVPLGKRSFPSGITQDWPENAPVTVETLATLMISLSDNTATDTLMRLVGRERIAVRVIASGHDEPERMLPMLTTWEAFTLKSQSPERIAAYVAANRAERSALLDALKPAADVTANSRPASILSIEWFASANDVAGVLDALRRRRDPRVLAILGVAPHLPPDAAAQFARIGYKGGSEPGVLNLSWLLQRKDGHWFVATASWNDPDKPVDTQKFELLALRLIGLASN